MTRIGWWWQQWRARHYVWKVWVDWSNTPNQHTWAVWQRALDHAQQVIAGRP